MRKVLLLLTILSFIHGLSFSQTLELDSLVNYTYKIKGANFNIKHHVLLGTGFIIVYKDIHFLVSNYHVFTGKDIKGKKTANLKDTCTHIIISFRNNSDTGFKELAIPLFDSTGEQLFSIYHGNDSMLIDIAITPIFLEDFPPNIKIYSIKETNIDTSRAYVDGNNTYIVGYPLGEYKNKWMPTIIKTKRVKEVVKGFFTTPYVSFDSSSIEGMSGSPIFIQNNANNIYLVAVNSGNFIPTIENPNIKGRGFQIKFAYDLILEMIKQKKSHVELFYR